MSDDDLIFVRDHRAPDRSRHQNARAAIAGQERRVGRGVYVASDRWARLDELARYRLRVRAVAGTRVAPVVVSHESAAVLHGLDLDAASGLPVHLSSAHGHGARSRAGLVAHRIAVPPGEVTVVEEVRVTSLLRTVVDLALASDFLDAVVAIDSALRPAERGGVGGVTSADALSLLAARRVARGRRRAERVLSFADPRAETAIESASRASLRIVGCDDPVLQQPLTDERVLLDEKRREDRLRALGHTVVRWDWRTAIDPGALARRVVAAGLPIAQR